MFTRRMLRLLLRMLLWRWTLALLIAFNASSGAFSSPPALQAKTVANSPSPSFREMAYLPTVAVTCRSSTTGGSSGCELQVDSSAEFCGAFLLSKRACMVSKPAAAPATAAPLLAAAGRPTADA